MHHGERDGGKGLFWRVPPAVQPRCSRRCASATSACWIGPCAIAGAVLAAFGIFFVASLGLGWLVGEDFFPAVDSGQMRLHARGPAGTRIEETEVRFADLEREIRAVIPPDEIEMMIDNIGIPNSWPAIAQGDIPTISSADGEILISLNKEKHGPTRDYEVLLRKRLREQFPDMTFFFQPANITSQILNFGLPAPIDLQVVGRERRRQLRIAQKLAAKDRAHSRGGRRACPPGGRPAVIRLDVDRAKAVADGPDAARRHQQHADLAQRQRHGGAEFLDELDERRQLQRGRADAAIPHRFEKTGNDHHRNHEHLQSCIHQLLQRIEFAQDCLFRGMWSVAKNPEDIIFRLCPQIFPCR